MKKDNVIKYLPIFLVSIYSIGTIILFMISPWDWRIVNPTKLYLFLGLWNVALVAGYMLAVKKYKSTKCNYGKYESNIVKFLTIIIIVYMVISLIDIIRIYDLTLSNSISTILDAMANPGKYYYNYKQGTGLIDKLFIWGNMALAPIFYSTIPLGVYYFNKMKKIGQISLISLIIVEALKWILKGTNKGLFDLFIVILIPIFIKFIKSIQKNKIKKISNKNKIFIVIGCILAGLLVVYFCNNIADRVSNLEESLGQIMNNTKIDQDNILKNILPQGLYSMLLVISSYLGQGYYGLSMALQLPFTTTYGIGFSNFFMANANEILNVDLFNSTYLAKLEPLGWSPTVNWHTMYLWFANDVSFIGVILVMFIIGFIFAEMWLSYLYEKNPISIALLTLFGIMFMYISANNQVFNSPFNCVAFIGLTIIWKIFRIKERRVNL